MYPGQSTPEQKEQGERALASIDRRLQAHFFEHATQEVAEDAQRVFSSSLPFDSKHELRQTLNSTYTIAKRSGFSFEDMLVAAACSAWEHASRSETPITEEAVVGLFTDEELLNGLLTADEIACIGRRTTAILIADAEQQ